MKTDEVKRADKMRYLKKIMLLIIFCVLLSGCSKNMLNELNKSNKVSDKLPDIMFAFYSQDFVSDEYMLYMFDKQGNLYFSDEEEIASAGYDELLEKYVSGELQSKVPVAATVEVSELQDNYELFKEIMISGKFNLIADYEGEGVEEVPSKFWEGIYYNNDGEVGIFTFYQEDMSEYTSTDDRVYKIVDWMNEAIEKTKK